MDTPMMDLQKGTKDESREAFPSEEEYTEKAHSTESSIVAALTLSERKMFSAGYVLQAGITEVVRPMETCVEHPFVQVEVSMDSVGVSFEECIKEVGRLESQREDLVRELFKLEQPMLQATEALRAQLLEARRVLTTIQLEYINLQIEVGLVRSKLFVTTRDCIQSQLALAAQQYDVAQSAVTQEELQAHVQSLTEEVGQLRQAQKKRLKSLKDQARQPPRLHAKSDVTVCRRASLDLQRRLSGSMRSLEGWYEPRLLALLRRKQAGEDSLRKSSDVGQELKAILGPLEEQIQRLRVQRACLEKRIALMDGEREESRAHYKELADSLEETMSDLKLEISIQKKANSQLEEWNEGLLRELNFHRVYIEGIETTAEEE
ncbi:syncoilin [Esox lucius]|uniref:IF rod domain-containing protein n=1 Tax=Esox lucius TaxID=8010 RepID=A0A3P8ZFJ5_ESOLU|nr:syncoilin [Esox lucius]XP_010877210.2 syncoilin [Esox lucius]